MFVFGMTKKPSYLRIEFARRFQEPSVAKSYRLRPPYPPETFQFLSKLAADTPRIVLDVGCGTGDIARHIVDLVERVDAVDFSEPMIELAKSLPKGDNQNIRWIVGRAEEVALQPLYSLIIGGESLHWMDWDVVFPRFRNMISPQGYLAIVERDEEPLPWKDDLQEIIKKFSTNPSYQPYDMIAEWQRRGLFEKSGEKRTASVSFTQLLEEYVESFHSMSSLTRNSMGDHNAKEFDQEVRRTVIQYSHDPRVERMIFASIIWGRLIRHNL